MVMSWLATAVVTETAKATAHVHGARTPSQHRLEVWVVARESIGEAVPHGASLAPRATALDCEEHVHSASSERDDERLQRV